MSEIEVGRRAAPEGSAIPRVVLADPVVSSRHCIVTQIDNGRFFIRDVSLNGTRVDGKRLVVTMAGIQLQQDFFGVQVGNAAVLLVVQGTLNDDGTLTRESQDAAALLEKSFRLTR